MKTGKVILLLSCLFLAGLAQGASLNIPSAAELSFKRMYPHVSKFHWEQWGEHNVAIFSDESGFQKAFYTQDGIWVETRLRTYYEALPKRLQKSLAKDYRTREFTYVGIIYHPAGIQYRIESESKTSVLIKLMNEKGAVLYFEDIGFSACVT